jgi:hypothetical protein
VLPTQVNFVPHVPSVETGFEAVDVEDVEVLVDEDCLTVVLVELVSEELDDPQVPNAGWQPVPQ